MTVLEKGPHFLSKVRISGGGRCNVTHAWSEPREFAKAYPRGEKELIGPLTQFDARRTVAWFEGRAVKLKTEEDGRLFPITDSSQTIIDCLTRAAGEARITLLANCGVTQVRKNPDGFELQTSRGAIQCDRLLLASGGCRSAALGGLAVSLGHSLVEPVPSLFTFHVEHEWVRSLAGITVPLVEAAVPEIQLRERGPLLFTHWGLSGPAILRLSAWGARLLHGLEYQFRLFVNWMPELREEAIREKLLRLARHQPARLVVNTALPPLPSRLWEQLVLRSGVSPRRRWAALARGEIHALVQQLLRTELRVSGKSLNKDEFVTCGGVRLNEVDFKTMESKICPGLYFAGELLDIDGITGGFNFQAAWTTGWIAGQAMADGVGNIPGSS